MGDLDLKSGTLTAGALTVPGYGVPPTPLVIGAANLLPTAVGNATAGWSTATSSTVAFVTQDGRSAVQITSTATGRVDITAQGTTATLAPVTAGQTYSFMCDFESASVAEAVRCDWKWYDATPTIIGVTNASTTSKTDATTGWTTVTSVSQTAPAGAVYASPAPRIVNCQNIGEVHYMSRPGVMAGYATVWEAPGKGAITLDPANQIDAASNQIHNVTDPTSAQDAATKNYVDTRSLSNFSAPTGDLSVGSHKLTNVTNPASAQDAATKNYVDSVTVTAPYGVSALPTGRYWALNHGQTTSATRGSGNLYLTPLAVAATISVAALGVETTVAGSSGAVVRLGIFNHTSGLPSTLVVDAGTVDLTSRTTSADGNTTNTSKSITSATASFVSTDVGRPITGTNIPTGTVIDTVTSSTAATMTQAATGTATTTVFTIGGVGFSEIRLGSAQSLSPGRYYLGADLQGSPATQPTFRITGTFTLAYEITDTVPTNLTSGGSPFAAYNKSGVTGAFSDLTGSTFAMSSSAIVVAIKGA